METKYKKLKKIVEEICYIVFMTLIIIGGFFCLYKALEGYAIQEDFYPQVDHAVFGMLPFSYDEEIFGEGDDVSSHFYKKIEDNYNLIPEVIRDDYESKGGKIYVKQDIQDEIDGLKDKTYQNNYFRAFYYNKSHRIVIRYVPFYDSIIHEMGHYFSMTYGLDCGEKLVDALREEGVTMLNEFRHSGTDTSLDEFYAVAFSMYFTQSEKLKELCPKAYQIIDYDVRNAEKIINEGNAKIEN